jgi:hypothetical protein
VEEAEMKVRATRGVGSRVAVLLGVLTLTVSGSVVLSPSPAGATSVSNEAGFRASWTNASETQIDLTADITLNCTSGAGDGVASRNSSTAITVDGHGHTITQACATGSSGVLESIGSGAVTLQNVTITGGNTSSSSVLPNRAGGVYTNGSLTLSNCTVSNNHATSAGLAAGGVLDENGTLSITSCTLSGNTDTSVGEVGGAAVFEGKGLLNITDSALTGNTATAAVVTPPHASDVAGGVVNNGTNINITRSSITNNRATGINIGGGVVNEAGTETVVNSTISYNTATAGSTTNTGQGAAGGILNQGGAETLVYVTLDGNTGTTGAMNEAANYVNQGGAVQFFGTAVGDPHNGPNCFLLSTSTGTPPSFVSNGYNLEDDAAATCGFSTSTPDIVGQSPQLAAPANNGGLGPTQLPASTSPLINAIPVAHCQDVGAAGVTTDERLIGRPQGSGCDIGAVEVQAATGPPSCPSGATCITNGNIPGNIYVPAGQSLVLTNSTVGGSITASNPASITVCGSTVNGAVTISGATRFVLLGDPGDDRCAGNTFRGNMTLSNNTGGLEVGSNHISGNTYVSGNSGAGPFLPDDDRPEIEGNTVGGYLYCTGNSPGLKNDGPPNNSVAGARYGQCVAPF